MTLKECYEAMGADYDDVIGRLRSERLVQKFVLKFLDDGSFGTLCRSFADGNIDEAFRASHTIKGMCQNLSFTRLMESSSELTELLRGGTAQPGAAESFERVRTDYETTVNTIRAFRDGLPS